MRLRASRPSVVDLYAAPELAVLAVLEAGVDVALVALVAAHPEDLDDEDPAPHERRAARQLIEAARDLASAVNRYRLALACARDRERDGLLPF
jgi:hypothetical protein